MGCSDGGDEQVIRADTGLLIDGGNAADGGDESDAQAGPGTGSIVVTVFAPDENVVAQPVAGASAAFRNADGSLASLAETGVDGVARGDVTVGGFVVVTQTVDDLPYVTFVQSVVAGDEITLVPNNLFGGRSGQASYTVQPRDATTRYEAFGPCGNGLANAPSTSMTFFLRSGCPATAPIVARALDADVSTVLGFAIEPAVMLQNEGEFVSEAVWTTPGQQATRLSGIPAGASVSSAAWAVLEDGRTVISNLQRGAATDGVVEQNIPYPVGIGDSAQYSVLLTATDFVARAGTHFGTPPETTAVLDLTDQIPTLNSVSFDGETISWTLTGAMHDGVVVSLVGETPGEKGSSTMAGTFVAVLPPGTTSVTLPSEADFETTIHSVTVDAVELSDRDGYDAFRPDATLRVAKAYAPLAAGAGDIVSWVLASAYTSNN